MTDYCYDTEFLEDGKTINLISIGIVCEDGREYYAVNSDMDHDRIRKDDWLCKNVVARLPLAGTGPNAAPRKSDNRWSYTLDHHSPLVKPKWVIRNEVREFLLAGVDTTLPEGMSMHHPRLWAYYGAYDHVALAQLWGPMRIMPKGIPWVTYDLRQEMNRLGVPSTAIPKPVNAHDALADARWNMEMLKHLRTVAGPR